MNDQTEFAVYVAQTPEKGLAEPQIILRCKVVDGRLVILQGDIAVPDNIAPLARTIRRKLQPKSGNQLFVS